MINSSGAGDNYILSVVNDTSSNDNDVLYGGAGDDMLLGSSGDNTLDGGTGTDTIWSGTGSDTIVIRSGEEAQRSPMLTYSKTSQMAPM